MLVWLESVLHLLREYWGALGLTAFIGTGIKALKMWFDLRKARQDLRNSENEGERLKREIGKLDREKAVKDGVVLLFRQAVAHTTPGSIGFAVLPKSQWASFLPDPSMVDEVLRELNASKTGSVGDEREFWKVDYNPPEPAGRRRG